MLEQYKLNWNYGGIDDIVVLSLTVVEIAPHLDGDNTVLREGLWELIWYISIPDCFR